ncbi:MAG: DNA polymerase III subunit beta [Fusobacteria bacterium]|nr:DNA polymerase III subunit beta [Fusobacteriota bacterium]
MLNIRVNREVFIKAIQIVEKAALDNKIRPVLSGIFLEAKGETITLKGSDLEITMKMEISGDVLEEGQVVFPYHLLHEYLKATSSETVLLTETEANSFVVSTSESTTEIQLFDAREYPTLQTLEEGIEYFINKEEFIETLEKTKIAAGQSADNLAINCVRVELEKNVMKVIATDTFRMVYHCSTLEGEAFPTECIKMSIPLKTVDILIKSLKSIEGTVFNLRYNGNQVLFRSGEMSILSRLIDLEFPNYQGILSSAQFDKKVFMNTHDFNSILKRVLIFVRNNKEAKNSAVFDFKGNKLHIRGISEGAKIKEVLDTLKEGEDIKLSLNARFILDFVENLESRNVEISVSNASKPVFLKGEGDENYIYLTMPLILREE